MEYSKDISKKIKANRRMKRKEEIKLKKQTEGAEEPRSMVKTKEQNEVSLKCGIRYKGSRDKRERMRRYTERYGRTQMILEESG